MKELISPAPTALAIGSTKRALVVHWSLSRRSRAAPSVSFQSAM